MHMRRMTWGAPLVTRRTAPLGAFMAASVRLMTGLNGVNLITSNESSFSLVQRSAGSVGERVGTASMITLSMASRSADLRLAERAAKKVSSSSSMSPKRVGGLRVSSFLVRVPVLSEHSTVMPASSSMALRRATMTLREARRRAPTAMVEVHTTCMAMGMDATSSTITTDRARRTVELPGSLGTVEAPLTTSTVKMMAQRMRERNRRPRVMRNRIFWKRPWASSIFMRPAALP
mmetsp:Transcript_19729/g.75773  ORF Transcript_19729/g.75773 Transcript_19729/m.75773 type:complete len:233 (-) Transcript_19729:744-1442(-)